MLTLQTLGKNFRRKNAEKKKNHFLTSRRLFGNTINFKNQYLHPIKQKVWVFKVLVLTTFHINDYDMVFCNSLIKQMLAKEFL